MRSATPEHPTPEAPPTALPKCPTGIAGLGEVTFGGLPRGCPTLVCGGADAREWGLRLYVWGRTPESLQAIANLKRICEEHLAGKYRIEAIDFGDQIPALSTLVRKTPEPVSEVIGDLSNTERVLEGPDVRAMTRRENCEKTCR